MRNKPTLESLQNSFRKWGIRQDKQKRLLSHYGFSEENTVKIDLGGQ